MKLHELTIHELHDLLVRKEVTSREATEALYKRIGEADGKIKAYLMLTEEEAFRQADEVDRKIAKGERIGDLAGIPVGLKDIFCTKGVRTTCGSKILGNYIPFYDGTVIKKLKEREAVFLGKLNMDEFAMGSSTENSGFHTTRNPWDLKRIPGGSSGGSAAAVAADECIAALGTDTGGSIRQPASCCGVVGLKPTYGRVSRYGLVAFASSLDQIGPITKDVEDCAILLGGISGYDPSDSTSVNVEVPDYKRFLINDVKRVRIGIPDEYFIEGMDPDVERSVREAVFLLKHLGAEVEAISLPHTPYAVAVYYIICTAEASSNLARYDGVKYGFRSRGHEDLMEMYTRTRAEGFGKEVKRRIILGTYVLSAGYYEAYYRKASQVRTLMRNDFEKAFEKVDVILTPTAPTPAFLVGEKVENPLQMYLSDILTIPVNLTGIPAISIPCGLSREGLPIGLQIMGKHFDEGKILQAAFTFEQNTDFHQKKPTLL
ncbi:MAG: Asp-tRNA(Asn)/Glu-tRNA(Gln) amidotransferase subunit GatA [Deltaproteobacteria bacterium]|nr:Asp-tRNA(Asn)/Glu-tRNA(Gln) amidotransferase subunit GatA [Deltaproteobacteria bacterium]MBM4346637.1 Asp-tRNA(Asn)/Glu-tRNA(Gln) amidotransferase subunit GatA [Deltaproteobacteria bacterium]